MSDRRLTPANGRVAAEDLRGMVSAERYVTGEAASIAAPVADLCAAPGGARDRQLLAGAALTLYEVHEGWAFVQAAADGYVGYVAHRHIGPATAPTHVVSTMATHAYVAPDMKSPDLHHLSMGARLAVTGAEGSFLETDRGFVPTSHLRALDTAEDDPVAVAARLLGVPYLWGGNSALGIDCSGIVQLSLALCGIPAPGDSDMQVRDLGTTLPEGTPPERGDLMFWKGHVGLVADPDTLLHANAHHMKVTYEPLQAAITRIAAQGDGLVTRHARLT